MAKVIPEETRQGVAADYLAGMFPKEIKDKYNIGLASVYNIINSMKISELTEKEPAPAATETDSDVKTLQIQDTTKAPESQVLKGVNVLCVLRAALETAYGNEADIMALKADSDTASIMFKYGGTAYSLQFGLAF